MVCFSGDRAGICWVSLVEVAGNIIMASNPNQINERESRLALREDLEILYQTVRQSAETTDRAIAEITTAIAQLTTTIEHLAENSQEDRTEIRRIWEYLMAQGKNGHGRLE